MSFNIYTPITKINNSKIKWCIRVRAQAVWRGISRDTKEFRGINIIFIDDSNSRIHAFVNAKYAGIFEKFLQEGEIYTVKNFSVEDYSGNESHRCVRYGKHIYFSDYTKLEKSTNDGLKIPDYCFDIYNLKDLENMEGDKNFLVDVVGVIKDSLPLRDYVNENNENKIQKKFTITDGRYHIKVTLFDDLAQSFEEIYSKEVGHTIIVLASAKVGRFQGEVTLTNYPATRFYFNTNHAAVKKLRIRCSEPSFHSEPSIYAKSESVPPISHGSPKLLNLSEIMQLKDEYIGEKVICKVTLKKVEDKLPWFCNVCCKCDLELELFEGRFKCGECKRSYTYPERRFRMCTLCSDNTGVVPIILEDREVRRLTGKTMFELKLEQASEADDEKFPPVLNDIANKDYTITLIISKDNVCNASNVYTADDISEGHHMFQSNIVLNQASGSSAEFPQSIETAVGNNFDEDTPNTKNSSTKNRVRKSPEGVSISPIKTKSSKTEKILKVKRKLKKNVIRTKINNSSSRTKEKNTNESDDYDSEEHVSLQKFMTMKNKKK